MGPISSRNRGKRRRRRRRRRRTMTSDGVLGRNILFGCIVRSLRRKEKQNRNIAEERLRKEEKEKKAMHGSA